VQQPELKNRKWNRSPNAAKLSQNSKAARDSLLDVGSQTEVGISKDAEVAHRRRWNSEASADRSWRQLEEVDAGDERCCTTAAPSYWHSLKTDCIQQQQTSSTHADDAQGHIQPPKH